MAITDTVVQKIAPTPKRPGRVFKASVMKPDEPVWRKVLGIGRSGMGKTKAIVGILECGQRVFVADTDFGGNGLSTVQGELLTTGKSHLMQNLAWFEFDNYKDFTYFTSHPESIDIGGKSLWEWDPDVLVHEGLANFQEKHVTEYALDLAPMRSSGKDNVAEAREAGLWAEQVDWGVIRRATLFAVEDFLRVHNPSGKKLHKYVTCLQDAGKEDKFGEVKRGPLLMGAAREYMAPAFDLILTLEAVSKPGVKGELDYYYRCDVSDRGIVTKKRALPVAAREPANFADLWRRITGAPA